MSKAELQRKAELCREYLIIFSLLEPGLTKWRGRVCEELARTLIKLEGRGDSHRGLCTGCPTALGPLCFLLFCQFLLYQHTKIW